MYVTCIGNFDGVHIGHRKIMSETVKLAKKSGFTTRALTINYPWGYFFENFPGLIYPISQRIKLIQSTGIRDVQILDLNEIKDLSPEEFFKLLLENNVNGIVVGDDFTFGRKAAGDIDTLKKLSKNHSVELKVIEGVKFKEKRVSSSWIRETISRGDIEISNTLLGENFTISGRVYRDKKLGNILGFPTANIKRSSGDLVKPKPGVYIVSSCIDDMEYFGLMNAGFRPTINYSERMKFEVYFLDFSGSLYDRNLSIKFHRFLRPELKFDSVEKLVKEIQRDEKIARRWIKNNKEKIKDGQRKSQLSP
ncbi:MAG: riboflavin biosynthesis protein RibF [Kosmotoga sp.]|nr:MAG: riboflavin biosynthesis protein RibF [Kosmotoga sp.]